MRPIDDSQVIMARIDIASIDLNLLLALDALLETQHVTRAAKRIGLTQSSMSHALARLRELFGDPLLVRAGRGMVPTPRAEALREPLRRVLAEVSRLLREEGQFDAQRSTRTFVLSSPDLLAPMLPALLAAMRTEAPHVRLEVRAMAGDPSLELASGAVDLALAPARSEGPGLVQRSLGTLRWVVLARRDHPARRRFDAEKWVRYPHVQVAPGGGTRNVIDDAIARTGLRREIGVVVPSFLAAPEIVAQTDLFFTAPRELVEPIAARLDLVLLEPPIPIGPVPVASLFHERMQSDPAHTWFRELVVREVTRSIGAPRRRS
jgi:DNA-binding transcriptional LysR family regulator